MLALWLCRSPSWWIPLTSPSCVEGEEGRWEVGTKSHWVIQPLFLRWAQWVLFASLQKWPPPSHKAFVFSAVSISTRPLRPASVGRAYISRDRHKTDDYTEVVFVRKSVCGVNTAVTFSGIITIVSDKRQHRIAEEGEERLSFPTSRL